jgi:predicted flavoprotein YhiN
MATHATGTFEVKLSPQTEDDSALARLTIDKTLHGDLEATSKGQMLAASTEVPGSAGYVAMERVTGTLGGRSGSFVLQHSGMMARGDAQLSVTVVPDSGTGELTGLAGNMTITIVEKQHLYEFDYTLPETG